VEKSQGLGDSVEKLFKVTGIHTAVKKTQSTISYLVGRDVDCGCDKRKDLLNKLVPYNQQ
jgi:hypothetical protein